jgi:hypothetical protein
MCVTGIAAWRHDGQSIHAGDFLFKESCDVGHSFSVKSRKRDWSPAMGSAQSSGDPGMAEHSKAAIP